MSADRVEKSYSYLAGPADVFDALLSEDAAAEWMSAELEIDPVVGGAVVARVAGYPDVTGVVTVLEPPHRLSLEWGAVGWPGPLTTEIVISESGEGSDVKVVETGFAGDLALSGARDYLWSHWLIRLFAYLTTS